MVERRRGRIVNVASIHGMRGDANVAAQAAAKFGLIGLTQSLAREFRAHNIAINAVCPGTVENKKDEGDALHEEPLAEKLWPRDVARAVLFLASDDAAAITGTALEVFGGTHVTIQRLIGANDPAPQPIRLVRRNSLHTFPCEEEPCRDSRGILAGPCAPGRPWRSMRRAPRPPTRSSPATSRRSAAWRSSRPSRRSRRPAATRAGAASKRRSSRRASGRTWCGRSSCCRA